MIGVIAKLRVKPGQGPAFQKQVAGMTVKVEGNEAGNLFYRGYITDDPEAFVALEAYQDRAALEAHRASDHVAAAIVTLGGMLEGELEVDVVEQVW